MPSITSLVRFNNVDAEKCGGFIDYDSQNENFRFEILHGQCNMTASSHVAFGQRFEYLQYN